MPVTDPRSYMRVFDTLLDRIESGALPVETRLNIGDLALEFCVSRDTVQRAFTMLAERGKILRFKGLGWYVI